MTALSFDDVTSDVTAAPASKALSFDDIIPSTAPPKDFNTPLSADEEKQFQVWKAKYAPRDSGEDYDLRGAYKEGLTPDPKTGHWPDTYKKPNHPTFSNESKYAAYGVPGKWVGPNHDQYVPGQARSRVDYTPYSFKNMSGQAINMALGLFEQPGALAWQSGSAVASVAKAGLDTALSRVPGFAQGPLSYLGKSGGDTAVEQEQAQRYKALSSMPPGHAFMSEYNRLTENASKMYRPLSPTYGAPLTKYIGDTFTHAIQFVGDQIFEKGLPLPGPLGLMHIGQGSPTAGAAGQSATALALMLVGGKKTPEKSAPVRVPSDVIDPGIPAGKSRSNFAPVAPPFEQAWNEFATKYPSTAAHFDSMGSGRIRMQDFRPEDKTVYDAVGRKLDTELSLPDHMKGMTLEGKLRLALNKAAGDTKLPPGEIDKAVRAQLDGLAQVETLRQSAAATRGLPLIPDPAISKDPVIVTKSGVTMTADQAAASDAAFQGMSAEERANALGLSAMGRLRLHMERMQTAEQAGDKRTANSARSALEQGWAKNFPYRDPAKRADGLDRFINFGGRATYEEMSQSMGPPTRKIFDDTKPQPQVSKKGKGPYVQPWDVPQSQRGMITVEGFEPEKGAEQVKQAAAASVRPWNTGGQDEERVAAEQVQAAFDANRKAEEEGMKTTLAGAANKFKRGVFGHNIDLKDALEKSGPYGEKARLRMVQQNGATDGARFEMDGINRRIWGDLSPQEHAKLDDLVRARRIVEVASYNPNYVNPEGLGKGAEAGRKAEMWARTIARDLGPEKFAKINGRADAVFAENRKLLADGFASGLLSKESFDKLIHFDYSKTEYIDLLDPAITYNINGKPITIHGSGIPFLGAGKTGAVAMDARSMLAEAVGRVRNRQAKNNTLQALWTLADTTPDNGLVKIQGKGDNKGSPAKHAESGWTNLGLRIAGEQKNIMMNDAFADQFINQPQAMFPMVANAARVVSGSASLRASAIGWNPIFPLAGIPMDIAHVWAAKGAEYSSHPPIYFKQIAKDMLEVLPDLKNRTGVYEQAMREGLGAHYMADYGRNILTRDKTLAERVMPGHQKISRILGGLNPEADLWIRLAHRQRLIKAGLSPEDATARARDRLDYSEGGVLTKAVDTVLPWTNVAMQALYKAGKAVGRNPTSDTLLKLGWVFGSYTAWNMANMMSSPETWKGISTSDKVRGLDITYGDQIYVIDPDGNKRYAYTPVRFDQVFSPIQATVVGMLELASNGRLPNDLISETINQTTNVWNPVDGVPLMAASAAMMNFDTYTGKPLFRGEVQPPDETNRGVNPAWNIVGQATNMSPIRMQAAASKFISPYNPYMRAMGWGLKELLGDSDPRDVAATSSYLLASNMSPAVKLTNPLSAYSDTVQENIEKEGSRRKQQTDTLDDLMYKAQHGQADMKDVQTWLGTQPPEDRERLSNRAKKGYVIDQVMQKYKAGSDIGVPPKGWWKLTATAPDKARAQEYYSKWLSADSNGRTKMENIAQQLQQHGAGYMSDGFRREVAREKSLLGEDNR